ncbi:tyrosine-type recombinase/integrase [Aliarcobacter cryaerophilus]|uniref:tyrosine-type recombinase/integrase n=1 Tax=Aliarcobacter cryaerophilus TaxID=28198 RepID=UPI0021B1D6F8|nr:site-specific integrase [Aliarcobacter cryaerophilus]MCT7467888.1 site-specific integrase [Aliarcobacter cryaerophilus]
MERFVNINISNKDCKGLYLYCDSELKSIDTAKDAAKLIGTTFKMQLKTRVDGKLFKKTFSFNKNNYTFIQAVEYVASQRDQLRTNIKAHGTVRELKEKKEDIEIKGIKFIDRVNEFLQDKEISARSTTLVNYKTALLHHSKDLHELEFSNIKLKDIQKIIHRLLKEENKAPATVVLYARTLMAFFNKFKKFHSIDFEDLALPEFDNKVEYKLSLSDTRKIIKIMREYSRIDLGSDGVFYQYEEIKNIFAFSLTGRRISEILSLNFSDFNLETKTYVVISTNTKGKKQLDFIIDDYLLEAIKSQAKLRGVDLSAKSNVKVFTYNKETVRIHFQNLLKALNLPKLRLHDIRHMLGTTLVQNGVPIQDISRMLGHSSIAITEQRYAKTNKDQAGRATTAFNALMED